ncbi:MAG: fused response regulator/phosphatase [Candidatus Saccharimonas sp.]|nr:fused response regulator/phosphatase [Planctomycetaceae bacterium]
MRILVGWDNSEQADLISMYLGIGEHEIEVVLGGEGLISRLSGGEECDVVFLSITLPDVETGFDTFQELKRLRPDVPIVGACDPADVFRIVRFMTHGMCAYAIRDANGDYLFMLLAVLESAVESVRALQDQKVSEKLREEVQAVRKLQESMIPAHIDAPAGCQIVARYEPSQIRVAGGRVVTMAGGDYYDVFTLDDNHVVLLVGDASGHGMKAAMSIMVMHTLVRMIRTQRYQNTAAFVAAINNQLCEHSIVQEEGGFITLAYGLLTLDTNELQWTSAGHPIPLVQDLDTGEIRALAADTTAGLPLAIYPEVDYDTLHSKLPDNYRLLFYTDGLQEAFPEHKATKTGEFGVAGIKRTLTEQREATATASLQALFDESEAYTEGSGRHDDTSAVLLERRL